MRTAYARLTQDNGNQWLRVMADSTATQQHAGTSWQEPVLRPGRAADPEVEVPVPVPAAGSPAAPAVAPAPDGEAPALTLDEHTGESSDAAPADRSADGAADADRVEQHYAESSQRRLRRLLRQCERVTLMDFNRLSLSGWPDSYTLNAARRRRDTWVLSVVIAALVFLSGITGMVPAWIAGGGFGAFVVILLLGVPFVRRLYTSTPSYLDLIFHRQQLLRDARRHVAHLEGELGLIWQCNELSEFNPALAAPRFSILRHLSEQRRLAASLTRREQFRLYLIFMLEAEKAYQRLQNAYFEGHQRAIDKGWKAVAETVTGPPEKQPDGEAEADTPQADDLNKAGPVSNPVGQAQDLPGA